MLLTDAAIYYIEMGQELPEPAANPRDGYAGFEATFNAMSWLRFAELVVVDVQAPSSDGPEWIVLGDKEDSNVFILLISRLPEDTSPVTFTVVQPADEDSTPGSSDYPEHWIQKAVADGPEALLRAVESSWGRGRRSAD